jgi:hypothetical protein
MLSTLGGLGGSGLHSNIDEKETRKQGYNFAV